MTLNEFAARLRLRLFEDLRARNAPGEGAYDPAVLREAAAKSAPQMGSTRYEPHQIHFEFIYPDPPGAAIILTVTVSSPDRIVFLPVPGWVVESIWQGEIDGTFHFEGEIPALMEAFGNELTPERNLAYFGRKAPVRRE